jgi:hypothetical protein
MSRTRARHVPSASRYHRFDFAVSREAARHALGINQVAIHDNVELTGFARLDSGIAAKLLFD